MKAIGSNLTKLGIRVRNRMVAFARRPVLLRRIPSLASVDPTKPVYVFFAPEAVLRTHNAALAILARTLQELGYQVLTIRCGRQYPHCIGMDAAGLGIQKTNRQRNSVCRRCDDGWLETASGYGLPSISLSELVSAEERRKIQNAVANLPANAFDFEFDGFKFAALCGADLALTMKVLDQMRATGLAREKLKAYLEGALISLTAMRRLIGRYKIGRVIYYNEYSMLMGAAIAAIRANIPITRVSHAQFRNIDRTKIFLGSDPLAIISYHKLLDGWEGWRELALPADTVKGISDSALLRLRAGGHTVYSGSHSRQTDEVFRTLNLAPDRRTLVAYTSSMDEYNFNVNIMLSLGIMLFPSEQPFSDQTTWLRAIINYVEESKHLQLVIRIHPREGVNAHEKTRSDNLKLLEEEFSGTFKHVRIVWPEDKVSSYDLAELADLALTGWSNITLELTRLGIPALIAFKRYVPFPVGDVVQWAPTAKEYFDTLESMLNSGSQLDHIRYSFRWTNVYSLSLALDFDDVVPAPNFEGLPPYRRPRAARQVEEILVRGASITEMNRRILMARQGALSFDEETLELLRQMRRMIWFLTTGELRDTDYILRFGESDPGTADMAVMTEGEFVVVRTRNTSVRRRSKLIKRLALVAAQKASLEAVPS